MKTFIITSIFLVTFAFILPSSTVNFYAQEPCPRIGPCDTEPTPTPERDTSTIGGQGNTVNLTTMLEGIVDNFVVFKDVFINTIEDSLGGYFGLLAYILAWIIAVFYFVQQFINGAWTLDEVGRYTGTLVVTFLLLAFCGDIDNDGKRGDLVRIPSYIGYHLAFNSTDEPTGSFIGNQVDRQRTKFNRNYSKFIENKLMVKIDGQNMPVKYPGMRGVQTVAAVSIGQASKEQEKTFFSQEFWIGLLFQVMNLFRSIIEIIDFFLLVLYAFSILICSLICPFMCCVWVNRDFRKRLTLPFLWTIATVTVIFPVIQQAGRYFAYLSGNLALGTDGNPIYTFDATTNTIIANGDPTPFIIVSVIAMFISILCLVMSLILSYAFAQGRLVQSLGGLIANTFSGISSVGLGFMVSSYATKMQAEGEKSQIEGTYDSAINQADYAKQAQMASAEAARTAQRTMALGTKQSTMINAGASRTGTQMNAMGNLVSGQASIDAEKFSSVNSAIAGMEHSWKNLDADQKRGMADNLVDMLRQNNDAVSERVAKQIELAPERAGLLAEEYANSLKGVPLVGTVANSLGIDKDTMNTWMRQEGFKDIGQWMLGNPNTGERGWLTNINLDTSRASQMTKGIDENLKSIPSMEGFKYDRGDGTMVDALTGKKLSNNVIDATDPNAVTQIGGGTNVADIFRRTGITNSKGGMTKLQRQNWAALQKTMRQDPNFLATVQRGSAKRGIDPNHVLNMVAIESGFRKNVTNKFGYMGLGQVGKNERRSLGKFGWTGNTNIDQKRLNSMSASEQMNSLVFPFIDKKFGNKTKGISMAKMYAGWGSGHVKANANGIHMEKGGTRSSAYRNNPQWDFNKDGKTQQWEFGPAAYKNLGAGIFFDANKAIGKINKANPKTAEYLGKLMSADARTKNTLENNYASFMNKNSVLSNYTSDKKQIEADYAQDQIGIAENKAGIQSAGIRSNYDYSIGASNVIFDGQSKAANVNYGASIKSADQTFQGSKQAAELTFKGSNTSADIMKKASLDALYKRNVSSLAQSFGNSLSHQVSELFERASRGM